MNKEIRSLTGLRGIAAFYVIIYHFGFFKSENGILHTFFQHGYLAVDLFFVLSGFVMALTYSPLFQDGSKFLNYKIFMERRFARIYPLYIFVTFIAILHDNVFFYPFDPEAPVLNAENIVTHIFLVQAWGFSKSFMGTTWSISTEMLAYALFPLLIAYSLFKGRTLATMFFVVSFIVLLSLYMNWFDFYPHKSGSLSYSHGGYFSAVLRCVAEFTFGILAYRLFTIEDISQKVQNKYVQVILAIFIGSLLFFPYPDLIFAMLIPIFILSLSSDKGVVARLLGSQPLYSLGIISYSLYLIHIVSFWFRGSVQDGLEIINIPHAYSVSTFLQIPISIGLATVSYFLIEKPGRVLLKRVIGLTEKEIGPQTDTPRS